MGLFSKSASGLDIILEVAGSSAGGAIVSLKREPKPVIVCAIRDRLPFSVNRSRETLQPTIIKQLSTVCDEIKNRLALLRHKEDTAFGGKIANLHCIFSSPWFI